MVALKAPLCVPIGMFADEANVYDWPLWSSAASLMVKTDVPTLREMLTPGPASEKLEFLADPEILTVIAAVAVNVKEQELDAPPLSSALAKRSSDVNHGPSDDVWDAEPDPWPPDEWTESSQSAKFGADADCGTEVAPPWALIPRDWLVYEACPKAIVAPSDTTMQERIEQGFMVELRGRRSRVECSNAIHRTERRGSLAENPSYRNRMDLLSLMR